MYIGIDRLEYLMSKVPNDQEYSGAKSFCDSFLIDPVKCEGEIHGAGDDDDAEVVDHQVGLAGGGGHSHHNRPDYQTSSPGRWTSSARTPSGGRRTSSGS